MHVENAGSFESSYVTASLESNSIAPVRQVVEKVALKVACCSMLVGRWLGIDDIGIQGPLAKGRSFSTCVPAFRCSEGRCNVFASYALFSKVKCDPVRDTDAQQTWVTILNGTATWGSVADDADLGEN